MSSSINFDELKVDEFKITIDKNIFLGGVKISNGSFNNKPMVFIHGSLENGRIFYSKSLKGIAPFFALNGYDAYVVDLRGKEASIPKISKYFNFNHLDVINDLEKVYEFVKEKNSNPQTWISHSWGGVLINCACFRFEKMLNGIEKIAHFAVKRSISVKSFRKFLQIDLGFKRIMKLESYLFGYVSSRFFGVDSEALDYHKNQLAWINPSRFVDPVDNFDYSYIANLINLPKAIYLIGGNDLVLGNKIDVLNFMKECGQENAQKWILSTNNGFKHNYDHNNMLTHPDSKDDIYRPLLDWLKL